MKESKQQLKKIAIELRTKTTNQLDETLIRYQTRINILLETQPDSNEIVKLKNRVFLINQELKQREHRNEI